MPLSEEGKKLVDQLSPEDRATMLAEAKRLSELQELEVTPKEEWKSPRKAGFLIELPSGNICRIRRTMNLMQLVKTGQIPNPLGGIVKRMIDRGDDMINMRELDEEARIQALDMVDNAVVSAMVDPRVIIPPEGINAEIFEAPPGAISIMDLSHEDKLYITQVAQGGTTDLVRFREEQARLMAQLRHGEEVSVPSKSVDRPKRAGSSSKRKR